MAKGRTSAKQRRCAIYTRKSTEEGLEQDFNSLDAQREACEAFISSQRHEGWSIIRTAYDDGGFSGGSMDRPALQQLLADIEAKTVDVVVVYKIDRLTRSLFDFAKIVEVFDADGVSFVSVTQQFNTTTSMGRLTLNVLLSFAQFEREVTGERIRDKIAASKRKGMWMGGWVPLGYRANDRTLTVDDSEAESIRAVFSLYLELGCARRVKEELERRNIRSRVRVMKTGRSVGGTVFSRGQIYKILSNPIYAGKIAHKGTIYEGQHPAIIESNTWDAVQAQLAANRRARRNGAHASEPSLLAGLIFDAQHRPLSPSHAVKSGKRYRYYVSRHLIEAAGSTDATGLRIPAHDIEGRVLKELQRLLEDKARLLDALASTDISVSMTKLCLERSSALAKSLNTKSPQETKALLHDLLQRVVVFEERVEVWVSIDGLTRTLGLDGRRSKPGTGKLVLKTEARLKRCGLNVKLVLDGPEGASQPPGPDATLIRAVVRAHDWIDKLQAGQPPSHIAAAAGVTPSYATRVMRLAFLAPDITQAILEGRQPPELTADGLIQRSARLPMIWTEQRAALGFRAQPSF